MGGYHKESNHYSKSTTGDELIRQQCYFFFYYFFPKITRKVQTMLIIDRDYTKYSSNEKFFINKIEIQMRIISEK